MEKYNYKSEIVVNKHVTNHTFIMYTKIHHAGSTMHSNSVPSYTDRENTGILCACINMQGVHIK